MLLLLVERYSRHPNFAKYTYLDEMKSDAILNLCANALKFKPDRSSNPFAFYTTAIHNSFLQYLNAEKKQRQIRDELRIVGGDAPSYTYSGDSSGSSSDDDMTSYSYLEAPDDANFASIASNMSGPVTIVYKAPEVIKESPETNEETSTIEFDNDVEAVPIVEKKLSKKQQAKKHLSAFVGFD